MLKINDFQKQIIGLICIDHSKDMMDFYQLKENFSNDWIGKLDMVASWNDIDILHNHIWVPIAIGSFSISKHHFEGSIPGKAILKLEERRYEIRSTCPLMLPMDMIENLTFTWDIHLTIPLEIKLVINQEGLFSDRQIVESCVVPCEMELGNFML